MKRPPALALVIHELATNSMKYGALSEDAGSLDLSGSTDYQELTLVWVERGGPKVNPPKDVEGYGSKLLNRSISGPLGSSITYDWAADGVVATLIIDANKLAK